MCVQTFSVVFRDGQWELDAPCLISEHQEYLKKYLGKVTSYRVLAMVDGSPLYSLYQPPLAHPAGVRSLDHRLQRRFKEKRIPATATLSVIKNCQCECDHCSAVFYNHSQRPGLTKEELQEAVRQTVDLGVTTVIFLGGEPLLRKDLEEIICCVDPLKAVSILFTNGELLDEKRCRSLKQAGLLGAFVSLDSSEAKIHDAFRHRKGLFDKAISSIKEMRKAGLIAGISSYLSPQGMQMGHFEKMMELGKSIGAQEITFFDALPSGRWLKHEDFFLTPTHRQHIAQLVKHYRKQGDYPGLSVQSTMTSEKGSAFCFAANTQFYMTALGDMCPCDFTPLTIGRFPEKSIKVLWEKMISSEPYCTRAKVCRMQDPVFRRQYIDPIPDHGPYPYPL